MELKPGFRIKLLTAIKAGKIIIPKNDVVTVVEIQKKGTVIQDILDNKVILPTNAKFKVISTKKLKAKLTSAVIPFGAVYEAEKRSVERSKAPAAKARSIQLAQVLVSNALANDDPISLAKLSLAGTMLTMSLSPGLDANQYSRLYQFARKLSQSV